MLLLSGRPPNGLADSPRAVPAVGPRRGKGEGDSSSSETGETPSYYRANSKIAQRPRSEAQGRAAVCTPGRIPGRCERSECVRLPAPVLSGGRRCWTVFLFARNPGQKRTRTTDFDNISIRLLFRPSRKRPAGSRNSGSLSAQTCGSPGSSTGRDGA